MTTEQFKAIVSEGGGVENVVAIVFDNAYVEYFFEGERQFSYDMLKDLGGEDTIICDGTVRRTGGFVDIPVTVYKPVSDVQGILMVNDIKDKKHISKSDFTMR